MNRDSSDRSREDIILSSLKRNFERILLEASLTLSNKETADNSFFIGTSLWVLERRLRHGSLPDRFNSIPSTIEQKYSGFKTLEAEMAFNVGLVRDAICDLSGPIIEEVETGIPPSWAPALVRLLSDDRLCPIQASLSSPQSFPTTTFLVDEEENPISVDINYASKWIDICCSLEHQNLVTDWNAKQKLVDIFGRFVMWHLDIISHSLKPRDIARRFHSTPSPLTEIPGTLNKLVKFLFDNRRFLEPSNGNAWLLALSDSPTDNPNWKANPAGLQKWDTITLSDSEIVNIKEHFNDWNMNFSTSSLLHPLGGRKKITEKSLAPGFYHVTAVDPLTQSISLLLYTELQDTKSEKPTESIPLEEIREWVELEIRQEDGFITLEELANRWLSTRGISFNKALKPHGHKASSLMELIVIEREDLYSVFDNSVTKSGLKLRVLKQGEDRETLDAIATTMNSIQVTNRSNKWLTNWPIPDEPEKIWDMMREVSAELRSIPTEKWEEHASQSGKLEFRWAQRFRRLIFVQATHNDNWSRKTHHTDVRGTPSDISPHGLLNNMVGAILAASKKDVEIDHKFISDYLDDLRESVLALSDEPHNPIDSWNLIEEKSQLQRTNLSEHARSHIKQQERTWALKRRQAKFGPVVSSPNLISDYLFAFSETPKSKDEFLACAKKAYSRRIKSSRTRYVGIRKSDEYVWKFWGIGTEKGLPPMESIILLLTEAGLSEDEIARLLMRSTQVKYPHTEEE